jgi:hypothetical protein
MRVRILPGVHIGTLAQLVEQWTENPCVPSSILGGTTKVNRGMIITMT